MALTLDTTCSNNLIFSPDCTILATWSPHVLYLLDCESNELVDTICVNAFETILSVFIDDKNTACALIYNS